MTAFDVQGYTWESNAFFIVRSFEGVTTMECPDEAWSEMERPPVLSPARRELLSWREYCAYMITVGDAAWAECRASIITARDYLPDELAHRLARALSGCSTPEDVRLTFASVQEQQLC